MLLIDGSPVYQKLLSRRLENPESVRFKVTYSRSDEAEVIVRDFTNQIDIVVFGDSIPTATILQLTKVFRSYNLAIPIFVLTRKNDAHVPRNLKKAGIDNMMRISEMGTPLFAWSFISTVEEVILKKKAKEYDVLHGRLRAVSSSLATLTHDINNPLSVIRLALYHLQNRTLAKEKRELFIKLLLDNIERIDNQMKELTAIRRQLNDAHHHRAKVLTLKIRQDAAAGT
ncbi:MAG TPA: histidine kinase dimerization/phospho-acceptor domain-containing protein [Bacteroidota bacterium]|nr:histidine kinase dimerization/phospho-acceptor domain-containing protein [Bacteroidota bacterium]